MATLLTVGLGILATPLFVNCFWWVVNYPNGGPMKLLLTKWRSRPTPLEKARSARKLVYDEWVEATRVLVEHKMLQRKEDRQGWQREWETLLPRDTYPFTVLHTAVNNRVNYKHVRVPAEDPVYTLNVSPPARPQRSQDYLDEALLRIEDYKRLHDMSEGDERAEALLRKVRGY